MKFEVLCVSMNQTDFSLLERMKVNSNIVIANQCDTVGYCEKAFGENSARMVSTNTKGVGVNRNISLLYSKGDICLITDDDVVFRDGYESEILKEFDAHPEAEMIIFNLGTTTPEFGRKPTVTKKFTKMSRLKKNPYGGPRIAFRSSAVKKKNILFSTLFGGGTLFPSGEDSLWIKQLLKSGLKIYLSPIFIGDVSYSNSTWFSADQRKICYGRGAYIEAQSRFTATFMQFYYAYAKNNKDLSSKEALLWVRRGRKGYRELCSYEEYIERDGSKV